MIRVARIINTRGLKGECKLLLTTDEEEDRFSKGRILYLDEKTPLHVKNYLNYKGFGYVFFDEITTVEQAEALKNHTLYIKEEDLPQPDEDEFYYHQLMGCRVFNEQQEELGMVSDILETGANLVLRVQNGDSSWLLPFVGAFVEEVDADQKTIRIHDMEGLR